MVDVALKACDKGLSVVPIKPGTKQPTVAWKKLQTERMGSDDVRKNFTDGLWFGIIAGAISGNLEILDFDIPEKHTFEDGQTGTAPLFQPYCDFLIEHGHEELLGRLLQMQTKSGGMVLIYRCSAATIDGNKKLAEREATPAEREANPEVRRHTLIETRGEGGYFLCAPTPGYKLLRGHLNKIPDITSEERELLLSAARFLDQCEPEVCAPERTSTNLAVQRPGDAYNAKASWEEILVPKGWQRGRKHGERTHWTRPGKGIRDGNSATTGNGPNDLLYIFSSSCHPFEPSKCYSKFAAYTLLNHGGDFNFAAQQLKAEGYGQSKAQKQAQQENRVHAQAAKNPGPDSYFEIEGDDCFSGTVLEDVEAEAPCWLWEPHLMRRHLNLLDAKGSSGKTTLIIATALMLSQGRLPFGGECEPVTTLYFGCEDSPGEVKYLAQKIGGDFTKFIHVDDPLIRLDNAGLAKVYRTVKKHNAALVCFDAITYYYAGLVKDPYNGMEIAPYLNKLRDVAREADCAIWNVRHFAKYARGKDIEEMGAGAEQWRNSHRRQLVLRPHPETPRTGIVCPARGSLNAGKGEAFGFSMQNDIFGWITNPDVTVFDQEKTEAVVPLKKLEQAKAFIKEQCEGQFVLSSLMWQRAKAAGISDGTLKRASAEMKEAGQLEYKRWTKEGPWNWHVPSEVDPFEDSE